jgi:ankyrin repeat protein
MLAHSPQVAELLLEKGANINAVDNAGHTPLMCQASHIGHANLGHIRTLELLLQKGADVNAVDYIGKTALMWASSNGNAKSLELLLKHGADANHKDKSGNTALTYAKNREQKEMMLPRGQMPRERLLIEHGATE